MAALTAFHHATPTLRVYYGDDSLARLPAELGRANCRRAVIFCGQTIGRDAASCSRTHGRCRTR